MIGNPKLEAAVRAYIQRTSGRIKKEDIEQLVTTELKRLDKPVNDVERAERASVTALRRSDRLQNPVRIVGRVVDLKATQLDVHEGDEGEEHSVDVTCARIGDLSGHDSIWSLDVFGASLIDDLERAFRTGAPHEFVVMPIALPVGLDKKRPDAWAGRRDYFVYLLEMGKPTTHLDLWEPTDCELDGVQALADRLPREGVSPFEFVRREIIDLVGIVGLDENPGMSDALDAVILQAFSCGRFPEGNSARVQIVLLGPPSAGKGRVVRAADLLQPTVLVTPANLSPAGLAGVAGRNGGILTSTVGALPAASNGACVVQDAQAIKRGALEKLSPLLNEAAQDGYVRKSVAGGFEREALVGFVIDLNLGRHMNIGGGASTEAAIVTLRSLMSRMDVVIDLGDDYERAWRIGRKLYEPPTVEAFADRARVLRLLIACMRDRIQKVVLSGVRRAMEDAHDQLFEKNRHRLERLPEAGDIPLRMALSFRRLVTANARAHGRHAAVDEDVDVALHMIEHSLAFRGLHSTDPADSVSVRETWLRNQNGAGSAEDWTERFNSETSAAIDPRTMRRSFRKLHVTENPRGRYHLPPGSEPDPGASLSGMSGMSEAEAGQPARLDAADIPDSEAADRDALSRPRYVETLYRRLSDGRLSYREAWAHEGKVFEHFGVVGDRGEITEHALEGEPERNAVQRLLASAREQGFESIPHLEYEVLLVECSGVPSDLDEQLNEALGRRGLGHCDRATVVSGTAEVSCYVVDSEIAKAAIDAAGLADDLRVSHCQVG